LFILRILTWQYYQIPNFERAAWLQDGLEGKRGMVRGRIQLSVPDMAKA
jgi:hypothetical protein